MQKHVNLVDLVKSFPTNIFLQNLASIQKRTSPIKFAHLAEKLEDGSISDLSTKVLGAYGARHRTERYHSGFEAMLRVFSFFSTTRIISVFAASRRGCLSVW